MCSDRRPLSVLNKIADFERVWGLPNYLAVILMKNGHSGHRGVAV
jgi:hypothetical protein